MYLYLRSSVLKDWEITGFTRRYQVAHRGAQLTPWLNSTFLILSFSIILSSICQYDGKSVDLLHIFITKPNISYQDAEYIKTTEEAWQEAIDIAKSEEGWKEEKSDKKTVS